MTEASWDAGVKGHRSLLQEPCVYGDGERGCENIWTPHVFGAAFPSAPDVNGVARVVERPGPVWGRTRRGRARGATRDPKHTSE